MNMKHFLFTTLLVVAASITASAEIKTAQLPAEQAAKTTSLNPNYLVEVIESAKPANDQAKKKSPLLIYLHGSGGRGNDINKIRGHIRRIAPGITKFQKTPCIVVAPQCLKTTKDGAKTTWQPTDLNILLEHLKKTLPIDTSRIYLTGNSMGGYGSWAWGAHSPQHFAAIAPVVGGTGPGGPKDVTPHLKQWAKNLTSVPVFAFAGELDKVVPAERSEQMVAEIKKAGGTKAKIKVLKNQGHNAGKIVFNSQEYFDWIFTQQKK